MNAEANIQRVQKRGVIPKVVGLPLKTALMMLENAGFKDCNYRFVDTYAANDEIVEQYPIDGTLTENSTRVTLNVSKTSWVNYLPAVFRNQSEAQQTPFITNFLFILQHLWSEPERKIVEMHHIFDPLATEPEFVEWLGGWIGLVMAPEWDDHTRRTWVKSAPRLYANRGTADCIVELIEIFTGLKTELEENRWPYEGLRVGVTGLLGLDSVITQPINRCHSFIVKLPVSYEEMTERQVVRLHQVIQMEKPAHTIYFVQFKTEDHTQLQRAFMEIGGGSIGVDHEAPVYSSAREREQLEHQGRST